MGHIGETTLLNNGVEMPKIGLGTYKSADGDEVKSAVISALNHGYRHIDTASYYQNEKGIGLALHEARLPREEIFITTKVWNNQQGYDNTLRAFEESRRSLGVEYVDLYLIHWFKPETYLETWRALEKLYADGVVRSIGVSNFQIHHLQDLAQHTSITPVLNQVEQHPRLTQKPLHDYCRQHGIQLESWSPFMRGAIFADPTLAKIGAKYGKTIAQVIVRWQYQSHIVTIPKSVTPSRIKENVDIFDFALTTAEIGLIDGLNADERMGPDPDNVTF